MIAFAVTGRRRDCETTGTHGYSVHGWGLLLLLLLLAGLQSFVEGRAILQAAIACPAVPLVLPNTVREVVSINPVAGVSDATACASVTGQALLVQLNTSLVFSASGSFVFGAPDSTTPLPCSSTEALEAAAEQYFLTQGLVVAGRNWSSSVCCSAAQSCQAPSFQIQLGPVLISQDALPGGGWLEVKGYQAAVNPPQPSVLDGWNATTQPNAAACRAICRQGRDGCISYVWHASTGICNLTTGEPSSNNLLVPCSSPATDCVYGWRLPGSCGVAASYGIRVGGNVWAGWKPQAGLVATNGDWSMNSSIIPSFQQGQPAASESECNCRCYSVAGCMGYTYRGAAKDCWLFDRMVSWKFQYQPDDPDTVVARVVYPPGVPAWGPCVSTDFVQDQAFGITGQSRIKTPQPIKANNQGCNEACGREPACQAAMVENGTICSLYDVALLETPLLNSVILDLQRCDTPSDTPGYVEDTSSGIIDWEVQSVSDISTQQTALVLGSSHQSSPTGCLDACKSTPGCGVAQYNTQSFATSCTLGYYVPSRLLSNTSKPVTKLQACPGSQSQCLTVYRPAGSCGTIASAGIVQVGQVWADWQEGATDGSWGSAVGIEPQLQGTQVASVSECACNCQTSVACVAYLYIGDKRTCWLQSSIDVTAPVQPHLSKLTTIGRLEVPDALVPICEAGKLTLQQGASLQKGDASRIIGSAFFTADSPQSCDAACLREPACVAFETSMQASSSSVTCALYSTVGALGPSTPGTQFAFVQRCNLVPVDSISPPPPITSSTSQPPPALSSSPLSPPSGAHPLFPSPSPIPATANLATPTKPGLSKAATVGVAVGASFGITLIVAVVAIVWLLKRNKRSGADLEKKSLSAPPGSSDVLKEWNGDMSPSEPGVEAHIQFQNGMHDSNDGSQDDGFPNMLCDPVNSGSLMFVPPTPTGAESSPIPMTRATSSHLMEVTRQLQRTASLPPGDPFMTGAVHKYKWDTVKEVSGTPVEEGVNAAALHLAATRDNSTSSLVGVSVDGTGPGPAPIQLSREDVAQQIEILLHGLIDKGSSAVVFQCRWQKQFGPNGLLAAKLLRDPYDSQHRHLLASFNYEARVLVNCRHPNVVRLYGYCLEPPTVCLIMELLPGSLKSRLYGMNPKPQVLLGLVPRSPPNLQAWENVTTEESTGWKTVQPSDSHQVTVVSRNAVYEGDDDDKSDSELGSAQPGSGLGPGAWYHPYLSRSHSKITPLTSRPSQTLHSSNGNDSSAATGHAPSTGIHGSSSSEKRNDGLTMPTTGHVLPHAISTSVARPLTPASLARHRASITVSLCSKTKMQRLASSDVPGPLTVKELLNYSRDIAAGLAHLHAQMKGTTSAGNSNCPLVKAPSLAALGDANHSGGLRGAGSLTSDLGLLPNGTHANGDGLHTSRASLASDALMVDEDMECALRSRIVHRDLKPANVLITSTGVAKISDFGLARQHAQTTVQTEHTGAGTLRYMAPEVLGDARSRHITSRVDIFSLGIMMWEMIAQQLPWSHCNDFQVPGLVLSGWRPAVPGTSQPHPLGLDVTSHNATTTAYDSSLHTGYQTLTAPPNCAEQLLSPATFQGLPDVTALIQACWQQNPKSRPTAGQVLAELQQLLDRYTAGQTGNTLGTAAGPVSPTPGGQPLYLT